MDNTRMITFKKGDGTVISMHPATDGGGVISVTIIGLTGNYSTHRVDCCIKMTRAEMAQVLLFFQEESARAHKKDDREEKT